MIINFLGTRGGIEEFNRKHKYHSSLLLENKGKKLLIDFGEIHKEELSKIKPNWVLITHGHSDHCIFTVKGYKTNIFVYGSLETKKNIKFMPKNFKIIKENKKFKLGDFGILPYKVIHSLRAPAFGYKIKVDNKNIIYNPDLVDIVNKNKILKNVNLYIGDGASLFRGLVRRKGNKLFGHCSIKIQINWCKKFKIKNIIFTHFGKEIVEMDENKLKEKIKEYSEDKVNIKLAYDGMKVKL